MILMNILHCNKWQSQRDHPLKMTRQISAVAIYTELFPHAYNIIQSIMTMSLQQHSIAATVPKEPRSSSGQTPTDELELECRENTYQHDRR